MHHLDTPGYQRIIMCVCWDQLSSNPNVHLLVNTEQVFQESTVPRVTGNFTQHAQLACGARPTREPNLRSGVVSIQEFEAAYAKLEEQLQAAAKAKAKSKAGFAFCLYCFNVVGSERGMMISPTYIYMFCLPSHEI